MRAVSEVARVDRSHFADGLVVPAAPADRALYNVFSQTNGGLNEFRGQQLVVFDQSLLFALAARTSREGLVLQGDQLAPAIRELDLFHEVSDPGLAATKDTAAAAVTVYQLLGDIGVSSGGRMYARAVESLKRIAAITVFRKVGKKIASSHLMGFTTDEETGLVRFRLNWRLTAAILGSGSSQYVRVSLVERNRLQSKYAKLLHAWLCATVDPGQTLANGQGARPRTMIPHIWGRRPIARAAIRKRERIVRAALDEVDDLEGWAVSRATGGRFLVSRPKLLPPAEHEGHLPGDEDFDLMRDMWSMVRESTLKSRSVAEIQSENWERRKQKKARWKQPQRRVA